MSTHAFRHPLHGVKHPFGEITFWTWAAAAVLVVLVLTSVFTATEGTKYADNAAPVIGQPNTVPPNMYPAPSHP